MYQPYPSGGEMPEPLRPEPPRSVQTAVKLMYVGAGVSALSLIASLATMSGIKTAIRKADPHYTAAQISSAETLIIAFSVVAGLIGIGLWLWMARANQAGKSWARITSTVLFGLDTVSLLVGLGQATASLSKVVTVLIWLIGLAAVVFLWRRDSGEFYAASKQAS